MACGSIENNELLFIKPFTVDNPTNPQIPKSPPRIPHIDTVNLPRIPVMTITTRRSCCVSRLINNETTHAVEFHAMSDDPGDRFVAFVATNPRRGH